MTIDKQQDGNYTITDNRKSFPNLSPLDVFSYVRNFLVGDESDIRTLVLDAPEHPEEVPMRVARYDARRAEIERQRDGIPSK